MTHRISPKLPEEGKTVTLFGVKWEVTNVEPYSDYCWGIVLREPVEGTENYFYVPTDYNTLTGEYAYGEQPSRNPLL